MKKLDKYNLTKLLRTLESSEKRKIFSNTIWLVFERLVKMGLSFFIVVWLARYLGPEPFGTFNYIIAFVVLFSELSSLGLNGIVTRDLIERPSDQNRILGTAFFSRLIGGLICTIFVAIAINFIRPDDIQVKFLVIAYSIGTIFRAFEVIQRYFESEIQSRYVVIAKTSSTILYVFMVMAFILLRLGLPWFILARSFKIIFTNLGVLLFFFSKGKTIYSWRFHQSIALSMLKQSWPLILSGLGATIYLKLDQIMLGDMLGKQDVGIYSVAAQISEVWYLIPTAITSSLFPKFVKLKSIDTSRYHQRLQMTFDILAWLAISISLPITFLAPLIVQNLYGDAYAEAGVILSIHIWASVFIFMRAVLSRWLIVERLFIFSLLTHGAGALVNIVANYMLIPRMGGVGAAIASVVSYAAASYLSLFCHPKTRQVGTMMTLALVAPVKRFLGWR